MKLVTDDPLKYFSYYSANAVIFPFFILSNTYKVLYTVVIHIAQQIDDPRVNRHELPELIERVIADSFFF